MNFHKAHQDTMNTKPAVDPLTSTPSLMAVSQ